MRRDASLMKKINQKVNILIAIGILIALSSCVPLQSWLEETFSGTQQLEPPLLATLQIIVVVIMVIGLLSLAIPIMPGLTIIWLAALIYGLLTGLNTISGVILAILTLLMVVGNFTDNLFMGVKARKKGASWLAILAASIAAVAGSILMPPFGGFIAALIVLFTIETVRLNDWRKAFESTREMALGCGYAFFVRFGIGLAMIGLWLSWLWLADQWLL